jgi:Sec-independent protein translocase protein TatA
MARSVGRAQGEFKKGLKDGAVPDDPAESSEPKSDPPSEPKTDS